jgi:hypothetical protein
MQAHAYAADLKIERESASPKYQFYQIVGWAINMYGGSAGVYLNL